MGGGKGGSAGGGGGGGGEAAGGAPPPETVKLPKKSEIYESMVVGTDPTINPGGKLVGKGVKAENLSAEAQKSIKAYTGSKVPGGERFSVKPEQLNKVLRGETSGLTKAKVSQAKAYQKELNESLSKLRSYKGETYRTISDFDSKIASKYIPGKIVRQPEFTSTSRVPSASYKPFHGASSGSTRFKVQSKTGKLIEKISEYKAEKEVLFRSGTNFKVTSKTWNPGRGTWDISLTEL